MNGPQRRTLGSYRISKELTVAEGKAYQAEDVSSGTPVILRLPPTETPPELWQETRRLGRLARLGLPVILEVGDSDEGPFVAFSPPAGRSLTEFVAEGGRVSREELVAWLKTALELLAEAHAENVLHRNLGPGAVMISGGGQLGLTGFSLTGLAPPASELQSPEQRAGRELSPASDLYSLAALFRRLAQPVALGGASSEDFGVDDPLAAVFAQAMSTEPWDRFRDVAEMEAAVRRAEDVPQEPGHDFGTVAMQAGALQELLAKGASAAQGATPISPDAGEDDPGQIARETGEPAGPDAAKPEARKPDAGKQDTGGSDAGEPAAEAPGAGESALEDPDFDTPGDGKRAPGRSGDGKTPAGRPAAEKPALEDPQAGIVTPAEPVPPPRGLAAAAPPAAVPKTARAEAGVAMGGRPKGGFPWAAVLLLLAVGAGVFFWLQGKDGGAEPPPDPATAESSSRSIDPATESTAGSPGGPAEELTEDTPTEPGDGEGGAPSAVASGSDDPALELARLLLSDGEALFGEAQLTPEDEEILTQVQDDIDGVDFEGDPRGDEPVRSLFGENPLLARANPLIDAGMRRRWLADAIHATGTEHSLAHLREETERLRRGEVSRSDWYAHVAACREFCNRVVSGLIYEHVQQVRGRPNLLLLFETASSDLTPSRREALEAFLSGQGAATHVLLIGRASRSGDREVNRRLSMDRVEEARRAVLALGIDPDRINAFGLGYEPPQLTPELARIYGLRDDLSIDELNQSVLVVAYKPT